MAKRHSPNKYNFRHFPAELDEHHYDTCATSGKNMYLDYETAEEVKRYQRKLGNRALRVYKCPYCDAWHLTKASNKSHATEQYKKNKKRLVESSYEDDF
jgi:hypothetical protein